MNTYKALKKIEEKWGVDAYNELTQLIWEQQEKIKALTKSRDRWRERRKTK